MKRSSKHMQRDLSKSKKSKKSKIQNQHEYRKAFGDDCGICFYNRDLKYVCECKDERHAICRECMLKWQRGKDPKCPTCKAPCLKSYRLELHKDEHIEINKINVIFQAYETCSFDNFDNSESDFLVRVLSALEQKFEDDPKVTFVQNCELSHSIDDFTDSEKRKYHDKLEQYMQRMVKSDTNMVLTEVFCANLPHDIAAEEHGEPHRHAISKIIAKVVMDSMRGYWNLRPEACGLTFGVLFIDHDRQESNISIFKPR